MNVDFKTFSKSVGKPLKFICQNKLEDGSFFSDEFIGKIVEIGEDYLIVKQDYIESDLDFNLTLKSQKRKLLKNKFNILTPLNIL
jgi:hypothetical protein